jgi:hypothetical protein
MGTEKYLTKENLDHHIALTLQWVTSCIQATGGQGAAARYHLWKGWSEAYPETTGYLIETLFDCYHLTKIEALKAAAIQSADWLCQIQNRDGSFPGGVGGKLPPIIFDTGMILFGLTSAWQETMDGKYRDSLFKAIAWLENEMDDDNIWRKHAYEPHYVPSYYTMVIWAILKSKKLLRIKGSNGKLHSALDFFLQKITPENSIRDWSFRPGEIAFTHTIAYTLQGMLEAGLLLKNQAAISKVKTIGQKILAIRKHKGKLAGCYDENWHGDYSFGCTAGQAQMSLVFFRLYEVFKEPALFEEANILLFQTMKFQSKVGINGWYGGIPGSAPIWGKYQRFSFPNWAAKFFLDACMTARRFSE